MYTFIAQKLKSAPILLNDIGYIIDSYSPYGSNNSNVKYKFNLNERQWCIREVEVHDGVPLIELPIEDTLGPEQFYIYSTFAEAYWFTKLLKKINR